MEPTGLILGAGFTGLAAARASGFSVAEANDFPGGICASYYRRAAGEPPADGGAYRFEEGGGHWIFGGDPAVLGLFGSVAELRTYRRRAAIYFASSDLLAPYPLQYHLAALPAAIARRALAELRAAAAAPPAAGSDLASWLAGTFGETLDGLFFAPFHQRYTAGLWREILPQDLFKSPLDLTLAAAGARGGGAAPGYNATFRYPAGGLDRLARGLAAGLAVRYRAAAVAIDAAARKVRLGDGEELAYGALISTLPLDRMLELTGAAVASPADPATSLLVLNIGGRRGPRCPAEHWIYLPDAESGCHRAGIYSNVEPDFLPRGGSGRVSFYLERSYPRGRRPAGEELARLLAAATGELQEWGWLGEVEVTSPSWVEVAYTWSRPGSRWREEALAALAGLGIAMAGRFARWQFQGIAESFAEGLAAGRVAAAGAAASRPAVVA